MTDDGTGLRARRLRAGLTQRELASRAGVSQPAVAAIESGRRRPSEVTRSHLDAALHVRPSRVLSRSREELRAVLATHGATNPRVVGSVARGEDSESSDLDLLLTLPEGFDIFDKAYLEEELERLLGVRVDVIPDDARSPAVERAAAEAVPL